jgi:hypothetical protein
VKTIKLKAFQKRVAKAGKVFVVTRSGFGIAVAKEEAIAFTGMYVGFGDSLLCFFNGKNLYIDCNECVADFQVSE